MSPLPRLILISGWAHDSSAMEELRKCLENTANVSSISTGDLWSAETKIRAPSSYAQGLVKMIEKTGGKIFLAGWSLGGMIALETAAYQGKLVAGVILISSTPKFCAGQGWPAGTPAASIRAMLSELKRKPQGVFKTFFKNVAMLSKNSEVIRNKSRGILVEAEETIKARIKSAGAMNLRELIYGLEYLRDADFSNAAKNLCLPALIIHGRQDAIIDIETAYNLNRLLALSSIRVYDDYGHGLPWQNPAAIAKDIMGFFEECQNRNIHAIGSLPACARAPARELGQGSAFGGKSNSSIAARFSAAASTYHPLANIQRRVAVKLMNLLAPAKTRRRRTKPGLPPSPAPPRILEIGCGTGLLTAMLACAFPTSQIDAIDISSAMIKKARVNLTGNKLVNWRIGDACRLPKNKKYPLIVSNCVLHWIAPIELIIGKIRSMLARDGKFACAIMVSGTLAELNSSRNRIAAHKPARVALPAEHEVRKTIKQAGLRICAENSETIRSEYSSAAAMLKQLHDQGLTGGNIPRNKTLLTRSELSRLIADYSKHYKSNKGVYASYRVFYCVATKVGTALRAVRGAQGTARPTCLMHSSPRQTVKLKGGHS